MGQNMTPADTLQPPSPPQALRRAIGIVAALNLGYFFIEVGVALAIGSVSLLADSIDFLEDASINCLILIAFRHAAHIRARVGMVLAVILLVPSLATLWIAWHQLAVQTVPAPAPLTLTGLGALIVNLSCALILTRHRHHSGSLTRAAFLSARNDAIANIAIILAGLVTTQWHAIWPDLIVGLGIAAMNAAAAHEVWTAARQEHRQATDEAAS
jgi:Co/Zn/Cd efflux system component